VLGTLNVNLSTTKYQTTFRLNPSSSFALVSFHGSNCVSSFVVALKHRHMTVKREVFA